MKRDTRIKMGDRIKDSISGFKGIATSKTEWLNGCKRWLISPEELHDGKPIEAQWFDAEQVALVKSLGPRNAKPSGGNKPAPKRAADPVR